MTSFAYYTSHTFVDLRPEGILEVERLGFTYQLSDMVGNIILLKIQKLSSLFVFTSLFVNVNTIAQDLFEHRF